jgi:hypothetical protein
MAMHAAKSLGKSGDITIVAPRDDFRAACDGIPGRVAPLDSASVSHFKPRRER